MALPRDTWYDHLLNGTGPLDADAVETLTPDPVLLELLREQVALPWPEYDEPEREDENDAPFYAMLLLGLLRDEPSIGPLIALSQYATDEDWEAVTEIAPAALGAIGGAALAPLIAEIERLEREANLDAATIDREELDDAELYRYWQLVICVEQVALNNPEVRPEVARLAAERIASRQYDRAPRTEPVDSDDDEFFQLPTPAEIWTDLQLSLHLPELTAVVGEFFERGGPHFTSSIFGTREDFDELMASDAPTGNARERLLETYRGLRDPSLVDEDEDDDDSLFIDEDDEDEDEDEEVIEPYVRAEPKIGRNDPCPCGSGKKYKKCHGAS